MAVGRIPSSKRARRVAPSSRSGGDFEHGPISGDQSVRPVDVLIIGLIIGCMGRVEQVRDGRYSVSAGLAVVAGLAIAIGGWTWFLQSVGWFS